MIRAVINATIGCLVATALVAADRPLVTDRRVYVPLEELDVVVERDARGVLLPKAEFQKLVNLAKQNAEKHPQPPAATVTPRCDYSARIVGDHLVITAKAELRQFHPDWQAWTFPLQRLAVERAQLNGSPAFIGRGPNGEVTLLTPDAGTHSLELELSTELVTLGSDQASAFSLLGSPAGELTITLPAGKRLLVDGLQWERPAAIEQAAEYRLPVGGRAQVQLRITDRSTERTADALLFATTGYGLHVAPGEVTWHALTTLSVFGRQIDRVILAVPGSLEIADVEATGLDAWEFADDPDNLQRRRITLTFGQPFDGQRKITLRGVMPTSGEQPWFVPPLIVLQATSHIGQIVVQHPAGVRLQVLETDGVRRATAQQKPVSDMPDDMGKLAAVEWLRFDAWREDFTLQLVTQPKQRELHAAVAAVLDVASTGLELQTALTLATKFAPLFEVDFTIPVEWTVSAASGADGQPLRWESLPADAGVHRVRVLLPTAVPSGGSTVVKLSLRRELEGWPVEKDPVEFPIPQISLPQASLTETALVIRGDDDLDLAAEDVVGLDPVPLQAGFERLRYQSQDTVYSGRLRVTRKPARIAAEHIGYYRIDPQTMHAALFAQVVILGGGARELIVTLPEDVGQTVRFQAMGAFLVEQQPLPVENGRKRWRLKFGDRVHGSFVLATELELPRTAEPAVKVPLLALPEGEREHGALVVEAGPEQRLSLTAVDAQGLPLAEMDPLDLPGVPYLPKERIVAVYRMVASGASLTLTEERFDKASVPTAVCKSLAMTTVVSREGEVQQRAEFRLQLAGVQQLRVRLDAEADLWAVKLDGQPVEVRRASGLFLIPIQGSGAGVVETMLELFYRRQQAALQGTGEWTQSVPILDVLSGQGEGAPVEVLEQQWSLVHPDDTLIIDAEGPLEPLAALDTPGWLSQARDWLRTKPPQWEDIGYVAFWVAVISGGLSLFVLLYRRRGGRGVVEGVLALIVISILATMFLVAPAVQSARRATRSNAEYYAEAPVTMNRPEPVSRGIYMRNGAVAGLAQSQDFSPMEGAPATPPMSDEAFSLSREKELSELKDSITDLRSALGDKAETSVESKSPKFAGEPAARPMRRAPDSGRTSGVRDEKSAGGERGAAGADFAVMQPPAADRPAAPQLAAPQAAVPEQPAAPPAPAKPKLASGLLSLAMQLEKPPHSRERSFRYVGSGQGDAGASLNVSYLDRRSGSAIRWFWIALGALLGWFTRRLSCVQKTIVAAVGLAVTCGLLPLAPVEWHVLWDGLFGALAGAVAMWLIHGCGQLCERCCKWCSGTKTLATLLPFAIAFTSADVVVAQEAKQPAPPAAATARPPNPPPKPPRPAVIVPYEDADAPLAAARVWLSHDKFVELYRLAHPEQPIRSPAPQPGSIVEALYVAETSEVSEDFGSLNVTARMTIRSYVDGQWTVTLPIRGVALSEAKLNGESAAVQAGEPGLQLIVPKPGLHVLDLKFAVPAKLTGTAGSFSLMLGATPAAKLSFALPQPKDVVRVNGSTSVYRRVTQNDRTWIELPVDRGGDLSISWQPEQAQGGGAAVIHVDSVTAVTLTDAGVFVSCGYRYRIRQGIVRDVSFLLPESVKLKSVSGPDVGGWELVGDGPQRKLRVFLRRNVGDTTQLTVDGYLPHAVTAEPTTFAVPDIAPQEITAEVGHLAIYAGDQFALRSEQVQSLQQINTEGFKPDIPVTRVNADPQLLYRYSRRPWSATLRTNRLATQITAAVQQGYWVTHRKVQTTNRVLCDLSRVPQSTIDLLVPADWLILDVQSAGLKDWYLTKSDDAATATLEFDQPRSGQVEIVLLATESRDPAQPAVSLRTLSVRGAQKHQRQAAVWFDTGLVGQVSSLGEWKSLDAGATAPELQRLRPTPIQFAFQSASDDPGTIDLTVTAATPRLAANSLTSVAVTDVALIYGFIWQWQIDQASVDSLAVETPNWLSGRMDFTSAMIREVTSSPAGADRTRWTIGLRGPVTGQFVVAATATLPPAVDRVASPTVTFYGTGANLATALETQRHFVLLLNTSLSQLTAVDPSLTEAVQREDVPIVVREQLVNQATEFVRVKTTGTAPAWTMQRYVQTAGVPASVNLADLVTVLARDGSYRGQATYTIKNRSRQFLAIRLPPTSKLLAVTVNGRPSRAVQTQAGGTATYLIALPKTSAADLSFPVQLTYSGSLSTRLPTRKEVSRGEIELPAPNVVSQQDSEDYGIPVARTRWTVYLPDDLDAAALTDPKKHNLSLRPAGADDDTIVRVLMQDYSELLSALESPRSAVQRSMAKNNLKQLGAALQNYSGLIGKDTKLAEENTKLRQRFDVLSKGGDVSGRMDDGVDIDGDGIIDGQQAQVQSTDAEQQINIANMGNSALFIDNTRGFTQQEKSVDQNFNFTLQTPVPEADSKPMAGKTAEDLAKQAQTITSNSIEARQHYQALNVESLDQLNRALSEKKARFGAPGQQGQQVQQGGGQNAAGFAYDPFGMLSGSGRGEPMMANGQAAGVSGLQIINPQNEYREMDARTGALTLGIQPPPGGAPQGQAPGVGFNRYYAPQGGAIITDGSAPLPPGAAGGGGFGGGMGGGATQWADDGAVRLRIQQNQMLHDADDLMAFVVQNGAVQNEFGGVLFGQAAQQGRAGTAGLSLPIQLPQAGQALVFSKAGGDPKLALAVRPRQTVNYLLGGVWALGWIAAVITLLAALRTESGKTWVARKLPIAIAAAAVLGMLLLASPFNGVTAAVFVIAAIVTAWQHRNPVTAAAK